MPKLIHLSHSLFLSLSLSLSLSKCLFLSDVLLWHLTVEFIIVIVSQCDMGNKCQNMDGPYTICILGRSASLPSFFFPPLGCGMIN